MHIQIFLLVLCPALHLPHGEVTYTKSSVNGKYPVSTAASFTCGHLYRREGHSSLICKTSGNWDHQTPSCSLSNKKKIIYTNIISSMLFLFLVFYAFLILLFEHFIQKVFQNLYPNINYSYCSNM